MKNFNLTVLGLLIFSLSFSQDILEDDPYKMNNVYERDQHLEREVVPFPHLREADVANMWRVIALFSYMACQKRAAVGYMGALDGDALPGTESHARKVNFRKPSKFYFRFFLDYLAPQAGYISNRHKSVTNTKESPILARRSRPRRSLDPGPHPVNTDSPRSHSVDVTECNDRSATLSGVPSRPWQLQDSCSREHFSGRRSST